MSFFFGDVVIKQCIELGLEDLKKQPWLIDDMMSAFVKNPFMREKYGQKEIDRCKEWIQNNKIDVLLRYRNDKDEYPCVTIALGNSSEDLDLKTNSDLSTEVEDVMPSAIGRPIPYIVKPFVPAFYNGDTGEIGLPDGVSSDVVEPGMVVVDPSNGNGYVVESKSDSSVFIEAGAELAASKLAVVPQYQIYRTRRERAFFNESYSIGCHVQGDASALLWLHQIVVFILLRYREGLLEQNGLDRSSISSSDMVVNQHVDSPGADRVFSRYVTLSGVAEQSWLKTPYRVIESVVANEDCYGGASVKILSNLDSVPELSEDQVWVTSDGSDEDNL
jgi:hypothetical protein